MTDGSLYVDEEPIGSGRVREGGLPPVDDPRANLPAWVDGRLSGGPGTNPARGPLPLEPRRPVATPRRAERARAIAATRRRDPSLAGPRGGTRSVFALTGGGRREVRGHGRRSAGDLDDGLQVDADPGLLADRAHLDLHSTQRGLDRGRPVTTRDGRGRASGEPAAPDPHLHPGPRGAVAGRDDDQEPTLQQDIALKRRPLLERHRVIERRPVIHGKAPAVEGPSSADPAADSGLDVTRNRAGRPGPAATRSSPFRPLRRPTARGAGNDPPGASPDRQASSAFLAFR